jgi:hypothetical protein
MQVILDATGENPQPRRRSTFVFLCFQPFALFGSDGPLLAPRRLPMLALFAGLFFHWSAKAVDSQWLSRAHQTFETGRTVRMPRRPQKTGRLLQDAAAT